MANLCRAPISIQLLFSMCKTMPFRERLNAWVLQSYPAEKTPCYTLHYHVYGSLDYYTILYLGIIYGDLCSLIQRHIHSISYMVNTVELLLSLLEGKPTTGGSRFMNTSLCCSRSSNQTLWSTSITIINSGAVDNSSIFVNYIPISSYFQVSHKQCFSQFRYDKTIAG